MNSRIEDRPLLVPREKESAAGSSALGTQVIGLFQKFLTWTKSRVARQSKKRIRVWETVSLGEKRFLAVVQVDGEQFLVGGGSNSIAMLTKLEKPQAFSEVLEERCRRDLPPA